MPEMFSLKLEGIYAYMVSLTGQGKKILKNQGHLFKLKKM